MTPRPDFHGFERAVRRWMREWRVPGVAVGIVRGNRTIYAQGYGLRNIARRLPVTERTAFLIGSCTKAFTASAVGLLVDEGILEWDRPVRHFHALRCAVHQPGPDRQYLDENATCRLGS